MEKFHLLDHWARQEEALFTSMQISIWNQHYVSANRATYPLCTTMTSNFINLQAKPVGFAAPTSQAGGLFGGAPAATTGFGATAAQPTAGAFGAPAASTAFGFGATNTATAAGGTGLFGQQAKPAFGAATTGRNCKI